MNIGDFLNKKLLDGYPKVKHILKDSELSNQEKVDKIKEIDEKLYNVAIKDYALLHDLQEDEVIAQAEIELDGFSDKVDELYKSSKELEETSKEWGLMGTLKRCKEFIGKTSDDPKEQERFDKGVRIYNTYIAAFKKFQNFDTLEIKKEKMYRKSVNKALELGKGRLDLFRTPISTITGFDKYEDLNDNINIISGKENQSELVDYLPILNGLKSFSDTFTFEDIDKPDLNFLMGYLYSSAELLGRMLTNNFINKDGTVNDASETLKARQVTLLKGYKDLTLETLEANFDKEKPSLSLALLPAFAIIMLVISEESKFEYK